MSTISPVRILLCSLLCLASLSAAEVAAQRDQASQLQADGNIKEAYALFQAILQQEEAEPADLQAALECQRRLNQLAEFDELVEGVVDRHSDDWSMLQACAKAYGDTQHYGRRIEGTFQRGHHGGDGVWMGSLDYDRTRALQLCRQAVPLLPDAGQQTAAVARFWHEHARLLRLGRPAWRLQERTDLSELPPREESGWWGWRPGNDRPAPVTADGEPVLYQEPESWAAAGSDGARWRHCLAMMARSDPSWRSDALLQRARFAREQFGVQTLLQGGGSWSFPADPDATQAIWSVESLADDELLARLATGVRRFSLPAEQHPIALGQAAIEAQPDSRSAARLLGELFLNRRQRERAATWFERAHDRRMVEQIRGEWSRIEALGTQTPAEPANFTFTWRNAETVRFTAEGIDVDALLAGIRRYLTDRQDAVDWSEIRIDDIGRQLVEGKRRRYLTGQVAEWTVDLDPAPDHHDRSRTITSPLHQAGAYLITAHLPGGFKEGIVCWIADLALTYKPGDDEHLFFVADAVTGAPVADANIDGFGFNVHRRKGKRWVTTREVARDSDADGLATIANTDLPSDHQWLATARSSDGRLATLGFQHFWAAPLARSHYQLTRGYLVTDRPVYRPGDALHISGWLRQARYDLDADAGALADHQVSWRITDPKGDTWQEGQGTTDHHGGLQLDLELPGDATLGLYTLQLIGHNAHRQFRVEEYKKPEFEVSVAAPEEPIALGEQFTATIRADYLFGAPVTEAEVHYLVKRSDRELRWFPPSPWDWLYGPGHWWFAGSYDWYPGWRQWGCLPPQPWWHHQPSGPQEIVAEATVPIGADGSVAVAIDTNLVAATMGDRDHVYRITAEVVDASRRTVTGSGEVIAAREPYQVRVWLERGWIPAGETIELHALARTADQQPVTASGTARLFRIAYDEEGTVQEQLVAEAAVTTDADGRLQHRWAAVAAGQYRTEVVLQDAAGRSQTGGHLFSVLGDATAPAEDFRYNALELIPDQQHYAPGETARVLVATARPDATVLLFIRPEGGRYPAPRVLRLTGRSTLVDLPLTRADMPNCFIEALTISDGQVHQVAEQLLLPPADRLLQVAVTSDQEDYRPGEEVRLDITVRDETGEPVSGPTILTVYDRAIDQIAGPNRQPAIKEFFWQWQRHHHPQQRDNLARTARSHPHNQGHRMQALGVFGKLRTGTDGRLIAQRRRHPGAFMAVGAGGAAVRSEAASMAPGAAIAASEMAAADDADGESVGGADPAAAEIAVRQDFADSAFWDGRLVTDENGHARVSFTLPEDLTTWRIRSWALGPGTRVGEAEHAIVSNKPLLLRLQAPRFFVERDRVVLSANVHNEFDEARTATVALSTDELLAIDGTAEQEVSIPAHGQLRVDWPVRVLDDGDTEIRMTVVSGADSDGMAKTFPVARYGAPRTESRSIALRGTTDQGTMQFLVPKERAVAESELIVQVSPSLAASLVESLPYLASYPHGCTEQTLNRFVPTVICLDLLQELDVDLAAVAAAERLDAGTLPDGGHEDWRQWDHNPVFHADEVADMVRQGVERLRQMQVGDGGWGWFSGWGERSYPHTTAVVVRGLRQAQRAGAAVPDGLIAQGATWLRLHQDERREHILAKPEHRGPNNLDALVFTVLVDEGVHDARMQEILYRQRDRLSTYAKAMLALTSHRLEAVDQRDMYRRNVEQFLQENPDNQTAWLDLDSPWWYWYGSRIEALAWYLKLLNAVEPTAERTAAVAKYLLTNRRHASYWDSTRDTALCIEALAEYLIASGELSFTGSIDILLDDELLETIEVTPANLFSLDGQVRLSGAAIASGERTLTIRRRGEGVCYAGAWLEIFDQQERIPAAGLDLQVRRQVYRLERRAAEAAMAGSRGQVLRGAVERYDRVPLTDGAEVTSGDLLEVELTIENANDYEYLLFEDYKPAGVEAVAVRSGYLREGLRAYCEYRDDRVALFLHRLAQGTHSLRYRVRAEIPGTFFARPTQASAMYSPELRGNSASRRITIVDQPAEGGP